MIKEKLIFFLKNFEFHFQKKIIFNDIYLNKIRYSNFEIKNFKINRKMNLKIFLEKNSKKIKNIIKKIDLTKKLTNIIKIFNAKTRLNKFDKIKKKLKEKKKKKILIRKSKRRNSYNIQNKLRFEKLYKKNFNLKNKKNRRSSVVKIPLKKNSTIILEEDENSSNSSFFEKNDSLESSENKNIFEKTVFEKNGNIIDNINYFKKEDIIKKKYNFFNYNKNSLKFKRLKNGDFEIIIYK